MKNRLVMNAHSTLRPILLVEDNDMDLDFCLQAFEEHGILNPVVACRDGDEAIEFIDAHLDPGDPQLPLLTLLDLRLPKVDGLDVLRHARRQAAWLQVPIVVLTTSSENTDIHRAYEFGVNSYLVKPVNFSAFSEVVKHIKLYWIMTNESPLAAPRGQ